MKQEIYDITGMHCSACSSAIERVTRKLEGVEHSEVNLPMNRMTIIYDESKVNEEKIIAKVKRAGFGATLHTEEQKEMPKQDNDSRNQKYSLITSIVFAGVLLLVSMGSMMVPAINPYLGIFSPDVYPVNFAMLQLLLTIPVLIMGKHFFIGGFSSLAHLNPNMDTLVGLSAGVAFVYSVINTFLVATDAHYIHQLYYESAATIIALVSVGKYLETRSKEKTKSAITKLIKLTPDNAILVNDDGQWEVPTNKIKVGDTILIKAGAKVPLDGIVKSGHASINEAMLTGESLPIDKGVGSEVVGGSLCENGAIYVTVTRVGKDTTLSKIIQFVEDAQSKKAPISRMADKVSGIFVPIVMGIAIIAMVVWFALGESSEFALKIFTSTLVIACPCALGLATPMAMIVGTGLGANHGILIRNGEILEKAHHVNVAIFDKTGTVTEGKPSVTSVLSNNEPEMLSVAYALEKLSDHPISKAICEYTSGKSLQTEYEITRVEVVEGQGLVGVDANNCKSFVGNEKYLIANNIKYNDFFNEAEKLKNQGETIVFVVKDSVVLGLISVADTIKSNSKQAIESLKAMGIKTVLLTGDHRKAAQHIADCVGFDEMIAEVLPKDKADVVKAQQENGQVVMMIGDGINDAPALTQADVGCAIGNGSDIAIDCADIVLMKNDLMDVFHAIDLSKRTLRNIKQNLFWAFIYNILSIPIATGIFYHAFGLLLNPMIGSLAMSFSSLFVVSNALRLRYQKWR